MKKRLRAALMTTSAVIACMVLYRLAYPPKIESHWLKWRQGLTPQASEVAVDRDLILIVPKEHLAETDRLLAKQDALALTPEQTQHFVGQNAKLPRVGHPYLVRAVSSGLATEGFQMSYCGADLCVSMGALGAAGGGVNLRHRPMIAYLKQRPAHVYVSFGMAE